MWICTEHGYFSVVADRNDTHGDVWVRARSVDDLRAVRDAGYGIGRITALKYADYPYRARVSRSEWGRYLADALAGVDYPNFKNRVHARDRARADVYLDVWQAMVRIEKDDWDRDRVAAVTDEEQGVPA